MKEIEWQLDLFTKGGYNWIKRGFSWEEIKSWLEIGLGIDECLLAEYLKCRNYQPTADLNIIELKEEFRHQEFENLSAQMQIPPKSN